MCSVLTVDAPVSSRRHVCDIEHVSWRVFSPDRTQPEPLFAEEEDEEEEGDKDQPEWKKRKIWETSIPQTFQTFNWTVSSVCVWAEDFVVFNWFSSQMILIYCCIFVF